jgi:hypothetical protein
MDLYFLRIRRQVYCKVFLIGHSEAPDGALRAAFVHGYILRPGRCVFARSPLLHPAGLRSNDQIELLEPFFDPLQLLVDLFDPRAISLVVAGGEELPQFGEALLILLQLIGFFIRLEPFD